MTDYIHAKGLKAGIYISPGPRTCAGYEGSYGHEAQDARTFAEWGFDFLKYDWCSYSEKAGGRDAGTLQRPYRQMWAELQKLDRDIVMNLCQYGMGDVWKWGGEVGHCWRTTGDLGLERGGGLPGFYSIGRSNALHWEYARPGAWNDPDYILIGWVGDAHRMGEGKPTNADAQRAVRLHVDVVPDGRAAGLQRRHGQARRVHPERALQPRSHRHGPGPVGQAGPRSCSNTRREFVLAKELEDGSRAVGLFNLSARAHEAVGHVGRTGAGRPAAGPRSVAAGGHRRCLRTASRPPCRGTAWRWCGWPREITCLALTETRQLQSRETSGRGAQAARIPANSATGHSSGGAAHECLRPSPRVPRTACDRSP